MKSSHIPMHVWLQAMHLMASSKKGISANQLHRTLGITLKSAWFLAHRIREAMDDGYVHPTGKMGGPDKIIEADETVFGPDLDKDTRARAKYPKRPNTRTVEHLVTVYSLVERGGQVRSFHVKDASTLTLTGIMQDQVSEKSYIMTDEAAAYKPVKRMFVAHSAVNHGKGEYVRDAAHTNSVENFFSIFKRGLYGTYQRMSQKHLARYLAEFDFRYNNRKALGIEDQERARHRQGRPRQEAHISNASWAHRQGHCRTASRCLIGRNGNKCSNACVKTRVAKPPSIIYKTSG